MDLWATAKSSLICILVTLCLLCEQTGVLSKPSQLKHGSRGTLTAVSYSSARAQLLTRRAVHGPHVRDEYRDAPVYVKESELPSHKRPRKN